MPRGNQRHFPGSATPLG